MAVARVDLELLGVRVAEAITNTPILKARKVNAFGEKVLVGLKAFHDSVIRWVDNE